MWYLSLLFALIAGAGAVFVWFLAYDLRFRLDSCERNIQGIHSKMSGLKAKIVSEAEQAIEHKVETVGERDAHGPDFGQMLLMHMVGAGGFGGPPGPPEPAGDRFDEIDTLLGSGGEDDSN